MSCVNFVRGEEPRSTDAKFSARSRARRPYGRRPALAQAVARRRRIGAFLYLKEQDLGFGLRRSVREPARERWVGLSAAICEIDYRWTGGCADLIVGMRRDWLRRRRTSSSSRVRSHVGPIRNSRTISPIVFVQVADAVGGGFVESLARPGGNATGFTNFEFDIAGKWIELLERCRPAITRVAVLRDVANPSGNGQFGSILALGRLRGMDVRPVGLADAAEMEHGITEFARQPNGALIILPNGLAIVRRDTVIALAAQYRLPAISILFRYFVSGGGLMSYGPDAVDQYRRAAGYVDRILKGTKPADLPVEQSTKIALTINLKAARALGLEVPPTLLAITDEVIE